MRNLIKKIFILETDSELLGEMFLVSIKELNGKKVVTTDAFAIGEVDGAEFDVQKGALTHLRVDLSKEGAYELKLKKPVMGSVIVCVPLTLVQAYGHVINLNVPLASLKNLQECRSE